MSDYTVELARLQLERCVLTGSDENPTGRAYEIIVVLDGDGEPHAYRNECEHIAVPLALFVDSMFVADSLLCATHGARYRLEDGYCFEGPCVGQSLTRLPLVVDGGVVRVVVD
jgi:nitrite reductase/ring-hydroxylating ferredoxin subunit